MPKLKTKEGWEIFVNSDGTFLANKEGEEQIQENTLKDVEEEIERLRKSSSQRLPFWEIDTGFGTPAKTEGKITSLKKKEESYGDSYETWHTKKRKEGRNDRGRWYSIPLELIKPNESNKKVMDAYIELKKQSEAIQTQMDEKKKEFEFYKKKEIIENFGFEYEKD